MRASTVAARDSSPSLRADSEHFCARSAADFARRDISSAFSARALAELRPAGSAPTTRPLSGMLGLFVSPADMSFIGRNRPSGSFCILQRGDMDFSLPDEIFRKASSVYFASTPMPSPSENMRDIFPTGRALERGDSSGCPTYTGIPQPTSAENLAALFMLSSDFSSTSCIPSLCGHSP